MSEQANAVIYRLTEFRELNERICEIRFAAETSAYEVRLKGYNRKRKGRPEIEEPIEPGSFVINRGGIPTMGYPVKRMGATDFVKRPRKPFRRMWLKFDGRQQLGLVADGGRYNRPVNVNRVNDYANLMVAEQWRDNLADPIVVTPDGEVINGQHRLAAMGQIDPDSVDDGDNFRFLVIFDVPANQVSLTDTTRRTAKDQMTIAGKARQAA